MVGEPEGLNTVTVFSDIIIEETQKCIDAYDIW